MAHTREHKEQIQTAPGFVEQLRDAISRRAASFGQQQEEGISAFQRGDPGMFPGTFNPGGGEEVVQGAASDLTAQLTRAIGGGPKEEQASRLLPMLIPFVAPGIIRNLPKKMIFSDATQRLRFREMVNLKKSINKESSDIGKAIVNSANESPELFNIATKRGTFKRGGVLGTSGGISPLGVPAKFSPRGPGEEAVTTLTSDLLQGRPIRGIESGKPIFYSAGDTFIHEVTHELTRPLIQRYMKSGSPSQRALRAAINELDSFPHAIVTNTTAQNGLAAGVSEAFARIADKANIVGKQISAGKIITAGEFKLYSFAKDLNRQANKAGGIKPPKFFEGTISVVGKNGDTIKISPDGFSVVLVKPTVQSAPKSLGDENKVRVILDRMKDKDRFIQETNTAVDKFLKESK